MNTAACVDRLTAAGIAAQLMTSLIPFPQLHIIGIGKLFGRHERGLMLSIRLSLAFNLIKKNKYNSHTCPSLQQSFVTSTITDKCTTYQNTSNCKLLFFFCYDVPARYNVQMTCERIVGLGSSCMEQRNVIPGIGKSKIISAEPMNC